MADVVLCLLPPPNGLGSPLIRYALQLQAICLPLEEPDRMLIYSLAISSCHRSETRNRHKHYYTGGTEAQAQARAG